MNVRSLFFLSTPTTFPVQAMTMQPVGARMPHGVRISEVVGRLLLNGEGVREKNSVGLYVGACCPARRQFGVICHLMDPPANRLVMYFGYSEVAKRKPGFAWGENFDQNPPVQQPAPPGAICQPVPRRARGWDGLSGAAPVTEVLKKAMVGVDKQ